MTRPREKTVKRLFAVSGNRCAFPDCPNPLVEPTSGKVTGQICHIKARSSKGPRYDENQTEKERHAFENLILVCPIHHDVIDDDPETYTVERLLDLKARHEARYTCGREPSDEVARQFLFPPYTPPPPSSPDILPAPGDLPPGSRLPFHRNALFTGRTEPLKALAQTLLHDQAPSTLVTQAVQGMGGVGKTQLAVEFAYRYGQYSQGVHWLNAAQPESLTAEIAACGVEMGLHPWPQELPEQVTLTLRTWQRDGFRLVILDNLEDVDAAREWLPRLGSGARLLLTARRSDWAARLGAGPFELESLSPRGEPGLLASLPARRTGQRR